MLTAQGVRAFSKVLGRACLTKILPFDWDSRTLKLQVAKSCGFWVAIFMATTNWLHCLHLAISYIYFKKGMSPSREALHLIWLLSTTLGSIFSINYFYMKHQLVIFSNRFFNYNFLTKKNVKRSRKESDGFNICEFMLQVFVFVPYTQSLIGSLIFFYDYKSERYLYYFIYSTSYHSLPLVILFWALEYFFHFTLWHLCLVNMEFFIVYWQGTAGWLQEIRFGGCGSGVSRCSTISTFQSLQYINQEFNDCFSHLVLPSFQLLLISLPTLSNYLLICHHANLGIPTVVTIIVLALTGLGFVSSVFPLGASIYSNSVAYLNAFRQVSVVAQLDKGDSKTIKSLFPLKILFGNYYFLRKFTVLRIFGLIVYWTLKALLIFGRED